MVMFSLEVFIQVPTLKSSMTCHKKMAQFETGPCNRLNYCDVLRYVMSFERSGAALRPDYFIAPSRLT
jgi:hypothetical protein